MSATLPRNVRNKGWIPRTRRRGAVTLELILGLPILVISLLAIIEFGMFFANMQQVALACRVGAEQASQTDLTATADLDPVPLDITDAITAQLSTAGITACEVILEHDVQGAEQTLSTVYSACTCDEPITALPVSPGAGGSSVRATVCVPMTELAPNCLALFGFDLTDKVASCSTTFRFELSTP